MNNYKNKKKQLSKILSLIFLLVNYKVLKPSDQLEYHWASSNVCFWFEHPLRSLIWWYHFTFHNMISPSLLYCHYMSVIRIQPSWPLSLPWSLPRSGWIRNPLVMLHLVGQGTSEGSPALWGLFLYSSTGSGDTTSRKDFEMLHF